MKQKLETEYRLRWKRSGHHHRTRYYSRKHFALKAAARYKANGYTVELHERLVVPFDDWHPANGEARRS